MHYVPLLPIPFPQYTFSLNYCFERSREHLGRGWGGRQTKCTMGDVQVEIGSYGAFGQAGQLNAFSFNPIFPNFLFFRQTKLITRVIAGNVLENEAKE